MTISPPANFPPTTWEELKAIREFLSDCDVSFLRFEKDQEQYNLDMESASRYEGVKKITDKFQGQDVSLLLNVYPHTRLLQNFPSAKHYCLWSTKGPLTESDIEDVVNKEFPNSEWTYMTRKQGYLSIPEIWHSHIYILGDKNSF